MKDSPSHGRQLQRSGPLNDERVSMLIVDGVCVLSEALAKTLMREHVVVREVRTVADKDAAVSILHSFHPDVVLLNVTCPDVLEMFAAMRAFVSDLQVLAMGVGIPNRRSWPVLKWELPAFCPAMQPLTIWRTH